MSLNGKCASCKIYVLVGSPGDILHTGEVCHVAIKTNCLFRSWENPADFRTMSTALLMREIAVNFNQQDWTQHDFYMASNMVSHFVWQMDVLWDPVNKKRGTESLSSSAIIFIWWFWIGWFNLLTIDQQSPGLISICVPAVFIVNQPFIHQDRERHFMSDIQKYQRKD